MKINKKLTFCSRVKAVFRGKFIIVRICMEIYKINKLIVHITKEENNLNLNQEKK